MRNKIEILPKWNCENNLVETIEIVQWLKWRENQERERGLILISPSLSLFLFCYLWFWYFSILSHHKKKSFLYIACISQNYSLRAFASRKKIQYISSIFYVPRNKKKIGPRFRGRISYSLSRSNHRHHNESLWA